MANPSETLHEALASIAISSTTDGRCDPFRRRLWRDAEYLGQFDVAEAWSLVHSLRSPS